MRASDGCTKAVVLSMGAMVKKTTYFTIEENKLTAP